MIYPSADKLDAMDSKYALVIVSAKRARQVKEGARRFTNSQSGNALTVALEEIAAGEITPLLVGEPEKLPTSLPATPVLGGLVSTSDDDDMDGSMASIHALLSSDDDADDYDLDANDSEADILAVDEAMESDIVEDAPYGLVVDDNGEVEDDISEPSLDCKDVLIEDISPNGDEE